MATFKKGHQNGTTVRIRSGNYPDYMSMVLPGADYRDLVFRCSDGDLYAHRIVIASVSRLLAYSFNDQMPGETTVISIPDIQVSVMTHLLDLAYTGTTFIMKTEIREFKNTCLLLDFVSLEAQDGVRVEGSLKLVDLNSACGSFWGDAPPPVQHESVGSATRSIYFPTPRDRTHYAGENVPEDFDFGAPIFDIRPASRDFSIEQNPGSENCVSEKSRTVDGGGGGVTNRRNEASTSKEKAGTDSIEKLGQGEAKTNQLDLETFSSDEDEVVLVKSNEEVKRDHATDNNVVSSVEKGIITNVSHVSSSGDIVKPGNGSLLSPVSSESKRTPTEGGIKTNSPCANPEKKKPVYVSISSSDEEEDAGSEEVQFLEEFENSKCANPELKQTHERSINKPGTSAPTVIPTSSRMKRNRVDNSDSEPDDDFGNSSHPSDAPNLEDKGFLNNKKRRLEESTTESRPRIRVSDTKTSFSSGGWIDLSNKRTTQGIPGVTRPNVNVPQFSESFVMNPRFQPSDSDSFGVNNTSSRKPSTSASSSLPLQVQPADTEFESICEDGEILE